jgi:hypothetical protein
MILSLRFVQRCTLILAVLLLVTACGIGAPQQSLPENPGPRVSVLDSDDDGFEQVTLTKDGASLTVDYPANWEFRRVSASGFMMANGENIIGRYAQGTLESAIFADDEVIVDVRLVPRQNILAIDDTLSQSADALELLDAVFQSLAPIRNEGIQPIETSFGEYEAATQTFNLDVIEYSVVLVQLSDNFFSTVYILNAPEQYPDNWDEIAEMVIESFVFEPAPGNS